MQDFPIHTLETAPDGAKPALRDLQAAFGTIPNIAGALANSPVLINSLLGLFGRVHGGSFTEAEIQTVLLTDAVTNNSAWAVAFHTALGLAAGLDPEEVDAIRAGRSPAERKRGALSTLARALIETRGLIGDGDKARFLAAGFSREHLLEVIAIVAASTITNYAANVADPPLEASLLPYAWDAATSTAAAGGG